MRTQHILLIISFFIFRASAQDQFPVSQYMFNGFVTNPATTGSNEIFSFNISHRSQWMGFEGAPKTQILGLNWPLKNPKTALGILVINDEIGSRSNKSLFLNYAYRIITSSGKLSFGLKGGVTAGRFKPDDIGNNEVIFSDKLNNYMLPNFGLGIYYYTKSYYAGASIPLIFGYKDGSNGQGLTIYHSMSRYRYYFTAGFSRQINNEIKLEPSFLVSFEKTSVIPEINCNMIYKDVLTGGLSFRPKDAFILLLAYNINHQTRVGISYDIGVGKFSNYHNGSFEFSFQYLLGYKIQASNPGVF
jgi:type IX secretion system PorP/SprF family membrane protein